MKSNKCQANNTLHRKNFDFRLQYFGYTVFLVG